MALATAAVWYWGGPATPPPQRDGFFGPRDANRRTPVRAVPVRRETIDVQIRALGTVTPVNTVTVRARLDGALDRVLFTEGQRVSAGQLLAQIDPRPYEVALAQAQGQMKENEARLKNAEGDLVRYTKLEAQGLITGQQVTTQEALVQQYRGALQANEAQVNNAQLQLSYTPSRRAHRWPPRPPAGRRRQPDARQRHQRHRRSSRRCVPFRCCSPCPKRSCRRCSTGCVKIAGCRSRRGIAATPRKITTGVLQTVDNQIDTTTGTIKLRARFDNADDQLFPNQFVNIRLRVRRIPDATVIPSAAVQRASFGTFVYVVKDDRTVTIRRIALGPAENDRVSITSGLAANEQIVLEGVDDLTEGAKVDVIADSTPGRSRPDARRTAPRSRRRIASRPGAVHEHLASRSSSVPSRRRC